MDYLFSRAHGCVQALLDLFLQQHTVHFVLDLGLRDVFSPLEGDHKRLELRPGREGLQDLTSDQDIPRVKRPGLPPSQPRLDQIPTQLGDLLSIIPQPLTEQALQLAERLVLHRNPLLLSYPYAV